MNSEPANGQSFVNDCNTRQHTATDCNTLHTTATDCSTLHHTATDCNALTSNGATAVSPANSQWFVKDGNTLHKVSYGAGAIS